MRKHRAHNNLRKNLRRVERPHKISVSILRDIPSHVAQCGSLKFRLSIWWNPLLHIISESDYSTVINNSKKPPQMIYLSKISNITQSKIDSYSQNDIPNSKSNGLLTSHSNNKRSIGPVIEEDSEGYDQIRHRSRTLSAIIGSGSTGRSLKAASVNISKYNYANDEDLDSIVSSINDIDSFTNTRSFLEEQDDLSEEGDIPENSALFPIRKSFVSYNNLFILYYNIYIYIIYNLFNLLLI
jgi:hypothetical protein